jgi:hypothetical protein
MTQDAIKTYEAIIANMAKLLEVQQSRESVVMDMVAEAIKVEREACAKIAETPIGEYEVVVACGTEPTPHRIPQYANWQDIAKAIRARGQA